MNNLYKHLKQARSDAKLSQQDIADVCKVSRNAVTQWEAIDSKKRTEPSIDKIVCIASLTGWSVSELINGKSRILEGRATYNSSAETQQEAGIPLISYIQAGQFNEAVDLFAAGYAEEYIARLGGGANCYALRVQGDSMTSPSGLSIPEGYIIHVDPDQAAENGDCVIAKVEGQDEVTFKQLKFESGRPYLKPLNPSHPPIFAEFIVIGTVIGSSIKF